MRPGVQRMSKMWAPFSPAGWVGVAGQGLHGLVLREAGWQSASETRGQASCRAAARLTC